MHKSYNKSFIYLIIALVFYPKVQLAQELSVSQLIKFRAMDNDDVNDILISKGWKFEENYYGTSTWSFSRYNDRANAWFYKGKDPNGRVYVEYMFYGTKYISSLKTQLKELGFTKYNSESHSTSFTSMYNNNNYLLTITYKATNPNTKSSDCYTIKLKKQTLQELLKEQREMEEMRLRAIEREKECEKSKKARDNRYVNFKPIIDSANRIIDSMLYIKYEKKIDFIKSHPINEQRYLFERHVQDSIEKAKSYSYSDYIKDEAALKIESIELIEEYGKANRLALVYESSDTLSRVQSVLYKNEKVKIVNTTESHYVIIYDYCDYYLQDFMGYVKKGDLDIEIPKPKK